MQSSITCGHLYSCDMAGRSRLCAQLEFTWSQCFKPCGKQSNLALRFAALGRRPPMRSLLCLPRLFLRLARLCTTVVCVLRSLRLCKPL